MAKAKEAKVNATKRKSTRRKKKEKKVEAKYQVMNVTGIAVVGAYLAGVWTDVPENKAICLADKKAFQVRDVETDEILSSADIVSRKQKREEPSPEEKVALRKAQEKKRGRVSLKPKGEKIIGGLPHEEDYVPDEMEASDLPQQGFDIVKDEARRSLSNPRSQRDVGASSKVADTRLSPSEAASLAFVSQETAVAEKFSEMKMPPRRG